MAILSSNRYYLISLLASQFEFGQRGLVLFRWQTNRQRLINIRHFNVYLVKCIIRLETTRRIELNLNQVHIRKWQTIAKHIICSLLSFIRNVNHMHFIEMKFMADRTTIWHRFKTKTTKRKVKKMGIWFENVFILIERHGVVARSIWHNNIYRPIIESS